MTTTTTTTTTFQDWKVMTTSEFLSLGCSDFWSGCFFTVVLDSDGVCHESFFSETLALLVPWNRLRF